MDGHHVKWRRKQLTSNGGTLDVWFEFLEDRKSNKDEFQASLGFFTEVFIPFVKFYFSESSRVLFKAIIDLRLLRVDLSNDWSYLAHHSLLYPSIEPHPQVHTSLGHIRLSVHCSQSIHRWAGMDRLSGFAKETVSILHSEWNHFWWSCWIFIQNGQGNQR